MITIEFDCMVLYISCIVGEKKNDKMIPTVESNRLILKFCQPIIVFLLFIDQLIHILVYCVSPYLHLQVLLGCH